jgi:alpha-1,2-mannosyltransferase
MRRWFLIRRLYEPAFQQRMLLLLLIMIGAYYVIWSVVQWATLTPASLQFDFLNYFRGAQAAWHGMDIYADFKRSWGTEAWVVAYIYPPFFAEVLAPLTPLGLLTAARIWLIAVQAAFLGSLWLIIRLHPELTRAGRRLFLVAALGFMPVYLNLKFQQVATLWLLLLAAALWSAARRRDGVAGLLLAIAASIKVSPIFFLALFARLERWRLALISGVVLVAMTAVTVLFAPGSWQFFTVVLPRIGLGTANWDNGSIDGLVSRMVQFDPTLLGNDTVSVAKGLIVLAAVVVIGVSIWQARSLAGNSWMLRLSIGSLVCALLIASSVTWQHHLVTLLLPFATALTWITARQPGRRYLIGLFLAYAMCWMDRRAFPLPADLQVHSAAQAALVLLGTSVKLAGMLLLWALLLGMLRHERRLVDLSRPGRSADGALAMPPAA